jgi:hypothetical protein
VGYNNVIYTSTDGGGTWAEYLMPNLYYQIVAAVREHGV